METKNYKIEEYESTVMVEEFVGACVDVPVFLAYCQDCPNYGKLWSCPPFDFSPEEYWRNYKALVIKGRKITPNKKDADGLDIREILASEKRAMREELTLLEKKNPGSIMLAAGNCTECVSCSREEKTPCRKPERMRYSIEALGGDVSRTASLYLNQEILWIQDGKLPEYFLLVGGLLLKN